MFRSPLAALSVLVAPMAQAADVPPAMSRYIYDDLMRWINHTQIVQAITDQNRRTDGLSREQIIAQDAVWRAEVGHENGPLVDTVMNAPLSAFLRRHQHRSDGRIIEVFVMDHRGLNVAASTVTQNYWQGDNTQFKQTYDMGSGAVFIDEISFDESTQTYQGRVSFAVTDPATGDVIGAITVALDAGAFS